MKKLILCLILLFTVTGVAFGKPAYKQWKEKALNKTLMDYTEAMVTNDLKSGYLRLNAYIYNTSKKADGDMIISAYIFTNGVTDGKARVCVTVSTSEAIDFNVGQNKAIIGDYKVRYEERDNSAASLTTSIFTAGWVDIPDTKTVSITNRVALYEAVFKEMRVEGGGQFNYNADFGVVDLLKIREAGYNIIVEPTFKNPIRVYISFRNGYDLMDTYKQVIAKAEAKVKEDAKEKAEAEGLAKTKRLLNDKKYNVEYEAGVDSMVVRVQGNDVNMQGETLKVGLQLNRTNYQPRYIQFRLFSSDGNTFGLMQRATIHTADGDMVLRCIMQNYYSPTYNEYRTLGYKTFTLSWCNSEDFYHLNDMLKSGKPIKISFSGSASVIHTLTASERKALSDLLDVVFTRWQIDRKTATGDWSD